MSNSSIFEIEIRDAIADALTEMLKRERSIIHHAVQAELAAFMEQYSNQSTNEGRSSVVRNGYLPDREILTGIGSVPVKMPKVRSRAGKPVTIKRNE